MSTIKDGGSAFPDPGRAQSAKQREVLTETGMSLRDYFAAEAMKCFCIPQNVKLFGEVATEQFDEMVAERAYQVADAMIKEKLNNKE